jgi:gliding motility-associated-like protein
MKRLIAFVTILLASVNCFSQAGKDGVGNISASATVNIYTAVNADAAAGTATISVASAAGFTTGDLLYIIQMQGAAVNCYTSALTGTSSSGPFNSTYGRITNYNNAGNNEYAQVASVSGNIITIDCSLQKNYTAAGKVQVLRVPRYSSLNITATGTITCPAWNGTIGGVIAIEVNGNTTISPGGRIDASATGFRGGITIGKTGGLLGGAAYGNNNNGEGAYKGESIAGDVTTYSVNWQGLYCRGAVANGGGGGDANNAGGGGGANGGDTSLYTGSGNPDISVPSYTTAWELEQVGFSASSSSGGGRGGYCFSTATVSPLTYSPGDPTWSGDNRRQVGGLGGRPLNYNTGRLFCGGGGGAGDENDTYGGGGGNGGGIINILSYGTISGGGQIVSNGQNGLNTITSPVPFNAVGGRDGAGGGGGGGAILVNSTGAVTNLTLSAKGGNGGNQNMANGLLFGTTAMAYGPGGGGGGGYVGTTSATVTAMLSGGPNGIVQYISGTNNCQIDNLFPSNGSTIGGSGTNSLSAIAVAPTLTATAGATICAGSSTTLSAATSGTGTIGWYTATAGGTLLGTGSPFTTSVFPTPGTYTIFAGFCPRGIYRKPSVITVNGTPTLSSTTSTICNGQTATLVASGATTYTWNTGSNSATINPTPSVTTVYTVSGANGTCSTAITTTVVVSPGGTISVNSSTICSGQSSTLTAGAATSYTWSTGSNNQSITVTPTANAVYTINATIGGCVATNTSMVTVNINPTVSASNASICSGASTVLTASGAGSYTWSTGALTSTVLVSPGTSTVYTVTGSSSGCINTKTVSVNVTASPTVTANSPSICAGQTAVVTASGATTYTWNTGPTTASISVSPSVTTIYTVTGSNGSCTSAIAATVVVNPSGTISVNSATVCNGQTATLTAGAAAGYTWSTGSNNQSITVTPSVNTVYTIVVSNGSCSASNTSTVTVNANPTVSANSATICSGQSATLTASGAATYSWSTGATTASISASPTVSSIYTVTGTGAGSCTNTKTVSITVNNIPTLTVNSSTICSGNSATLAAGGANSYSWNTGAITSSIAPSPSVNTVYTVTGTIAGCSSSTTASVNVVNNPTLSVNSATACAGSSVVLTAGGAGTYSWNTGATTSSISVSPGITTVYTVTGTNAGLCSASQTAAVNVTPIPTVNLNSNVFNICGAQSATIIANAASGTFSWSTGSASSVITASVAGVYNVTVSNACGSAVQSATVNSGVPPAFTITPSSTVLCSGQSLTLNTVGSSGTFTWSNGSGNTPSLVINSPGAYTATLTNGCGIATGSIDVSSGPSTNMSITATSSTICSGGSVTLSVIGTGSFDWSTGDVNASSITVTNTGVYTATVSNGCGTGTAFFNVINGPAPSLSIIPSAPSFCNGQSATLTATGSSGTYSWSNGSSGTVMTASAAGIYTAVVTNSCGTGTDTFNVVFQAVPSVSLTASANTICPGSSATLTANGVNGGNAYSWSSSSTNTGNVEMATAAGTYIVTYSNACGSATAAASISQSTLLPDFTFSPNGGTAPVTVNFSNASVNNAINSWSFGNGSSSSNVSDNSNYTAPGIYSITLMITNSDGCQASVTKTLEINDQEFLIPDAFTPNGDGKNDLFEIKGIERYPDNELQVFNRWGNLVYSMKSYRNTWDGTPNAKSIGSGKLPAGTYFYIFLLNSGSGQVFRAYVQIVY